MSEGTARKRGREIEFTVRGKPMGKGRPRAVRAGSGVRMYTPRATEREQNRIKVLAKMAVRDVGWEFPGMVELRIRAYYPIPASRPKEWMRLAEEGAIQPISKPDADNILKLVADALNGVLWRDDAQVVSALVEKFYDIEPRLEIVVRDVTDDRDRWSK